MGGSARNRQLLRIAVILGVVLLIAYMFFSWQSDVKACQEKAAAAAVEYQDLLTKFNKLTDELKSNRTMTVYVLRGGPISICMIAVGVGPAVSIPHFLATVLYILSPWPSINPF